MSIYIRAAFSVARDAFLSPFARYAKPAATEFDPTRHYRTNEIAWFTVQGRRTLRQRCLPHMAGGSEVWVDVPEKSE